MPQDPVVTELVKYFNEAPQFQNQKLESKPDLLTQWRRTRLTADEVRLIEMEYFKCARDFRYAAQNYFYIVDKESNENLFTLWESQELILDKIQYRRRLGKPAKLLILKARQLGALSADSKVLTANMIWERIEDLEVGDKLIAPDEFSNGTGSARQLRTATILNKWTVRKKAYRINLSNGKSIEATSDHPFLCKVRGSVSTRWMTIDNSTTRKDAISLKSGDQIRSVLDVWEPAQTIEEMSDRAWFAALLDGEGSLRAKDTGGMELCVCQAPGPVLDRARSYLTDRGYYFREDIDDREKGTSSKLGDKPVHKLVINHTADVMRILGEVRPTRFAGRTPWEGKEIPKPRSTGLWVTVESIEDIGEKEMVDIETTTKTFIAEGLVTHNCSLLVESMIAWRAMFSSNINALVVSFEQVHSQYLFELMQHIYDRMPWWLKPEVASRKMDTGLWFDNPDPALRRDNPGLNSKVIVQWANKMSGVGMGIRLNCAHISEYSEFQHLKKIVEQDLTHAFAEQDPNFFAILESTAKGTGHYSYKLWKSNVELAEEAEWLPVFLPWFFEKNRRYSISKEWHPEKEEVEMRDRASKDWVRCDNPKCKQFQERTFLKFDRTDQKCTLCHEGTLRFFELELEQLAWMGNHRKNAKMKEEDSVRKLKQEMASTAEEAFQSSGIQVFSTEVLNYVGSTVERSYLNGFFDSHGRLHGMYRGECVLEGCKADHSQEETPWRIWRRPVAGASYTAGVDVAEGLELDDSVIFINRVAKLHGSDEQVAAFVSNKIDPSALAREAVKAGKYYNNAMLAIERNAYGSCNSDAANFLLYPNMYKPRHITVSGTGTYRNTGWLTSPSTKPWLTNQARRWLKANLWEIRDVTLLEQLKTFQKDSDDTRSTGATDGNKDDYVMAAMIALFASHENDWDENLGMIPIQQNLTLLSAPIIMSCGRCKHKWPAATIGMFDKCPQCGCMYITTERNMDPIANPMQNPVGDAVEKMLDAMNSQSGRDDDYVF
jgi:hypothetical protein